MAICVGSCALFHTFIIKGSNEITSEQFMCSTTIYANLRRPLKLCKTCKVVKWMYHIRVSHHLGIHRSTASLAKSILFFYIYIQTRVSKAKYTLTQ